VVLASTGQPISPAAIDQAVALAQHRSATVVSIARVHGSAFGLPNPGLLPSRREREAQRMIVSDAIAALRQRHLEADGEVIVTRRADRAISGVARRRAAEVVVLETPRQGWLRRLLEGDPARGLRRRLAGRAEVVVIHAPEA
jgi:hypothetical protein